MKMHLRKWMGPALCLAALLAVSGAAFPAAAPPAFTMEMADSIANQKIAMDTIWTMLASFLVFFMNLGFAFVESAFAGRRTP